MQEPGGLPWGAKWGPQRSAVQLWEATTLECSHHGWPHLRSTPDRGEPEWHGTWGHQHHTSTTPLSSHWSSIWHHQGLQPKPPGALEWLQWNSSTTSAPVSQHSMPGRKPPSMALGALPSTRAEHPLGLEGTDSAIPDPMATSLQASLGVVTSENISSIIQVSHSPFPPTIPKTPEVASIFPTLQSQAPTRLIQMTCQMRWFNCKGRWMWSWSSCPWLRPQWTPNEDSWHWMLILSCTKMRLRPLRSSKRPNTLKRGGGLLCSHDQGGGGLLCYPCLHLGTIPQGKHARVGAWGNSRGRVGLLSILEACRAVLWTCPPNAHGVLMYPLQLLTDNVPLATILGMLATTYIWLQWPENWHQQLPDLQCQWCQHPQPEPNGGASCPTGKQPHQDQRKRRLHG